MSNEYVPPNVEVRKAWVSYRLDYGWFKNENVGRGEAIGAEFDRWLVAHDAEVAAKAIEDWADIVQPDFPAYAEKTRARAAALRASTGGESDG